MNGCWPFLPIACCLLSCLAAPAVVFAAESFAEQAITVLNPPLPSVPTPQELPAPDLSTVRDSGDSAASESVFGDFPALPPLPDWTEDAYLPPLAEELWNHGGSYLYQPEGDRLHWPCDDDGAELLRLPENWLEPRPFTLGSEFLGADPVIPSLPASRLWPSEYFWDNRFTAYGDYELFGFALQQGLQRQDVIGHQMRVDLDFRVTGTERGHIQFRPLGRRDSGGSFYQFNSPNGYRNNGSGLPDRYWVEGELHSFLGPLLDPLAARNLNFVAGRFAFAMHNNLLMNDEILGAVVSGNNLSFAGLSNVNIQLLAGLDSVDTFPGSDSEVYGVHASIDRRRTFYELTYAYVRAAANRSTHFAGVSRTKSYGPVTLALRGLVKQGDEAGTGSSHLLAAESNYALAFENNYCGFEHGVGFCNAFWAGAGWTSIGGGNFNRLRTAFVVNPLIRLAAGPAADDVLGIALGIQLFRHHDDESIVPEIAWESPGGQSVLGFGLRYLRKTGPRTFFELLAVLNESSDPQFDRDGLFASHRWVF